MKRENHAIVEAAQQLNTDLHVGATCCGLPTRTQFSERTSGAVSDVSLQALASPFEQSMPAARTCWTSLSSEVPMPGRSMEPCCWQASRPPCAAPPADSCTCISAASCTSFTAFVAATCSLSSEALSRFKQVACCSVNIAGF